MLWHDSYDPQRRAVIHKHIERVWAKNCPWTETSAKEYRTDRPIRINKTSICSLFLSETLIKALGSPTRWTYMNILNSAFSSLPVQFVPSDYSYAGLEAPKKEQVHSSQERKNTNTHLPQFGHVSISQPRGSSSCLLEKKIEEVDKVPVVLVPFEVLDVPSNFTDHVLQTRVTCEHAIGTLKGNEENKSENYCTALLILLLIGQLNHWAIKYLL